MFLTLNIPEIIKVIGTIPTKSFYIWFEIVRYLYQCRIYKQLKSALALPCEKQIAIKINHQHHTNDIIESIFDISAKLNQDVRDELFAKPLGSAQ